MNLLFERVSGVVLFFFDYDSSLSNTRFDDFLAFVLLEQKQTHVKI